MSIAQTFINNAKADPARVVFPQGTEPRVLRAARRLKDEAICEPLLCGDAEKITAAAAECGVCLDGIPVTDIKTCGKLEAYAASYAERRGVSEKLAARLLKKAPSFGAGMVAAGDADGMVCGVITTTAQVLMAAGLVVGYAEGVNTPSSSFIMEVPQADGDPRLIVFADCAMNVAPTAEQLADIAISSADTARALLGMEPKVAMLSFSTKGSGAGDSVDKVLKAVELAQAAAPNLALDGELQADSALVASVAAKKCPDSTVAGQANVVVFPDLDSGNIAYKLVQRLANAGAFGPVLQGFAAPVNDLSRGASEDDIVVVAAITALQSKVAKSGGAA